MPNFLSYKALKRLRTVFCLLLVGGFFVLPVQAQEEQARADAMGAAMTARIKRRRSHELADLQMDMARESLEDEAMAAALLASERRQSQEMERIALETAAVQKNLDHALTAAVDAAQKVYVLTSTKHD